jgi:hypothetical protein
MRFGNARRKSVHKINLVGLCTGPSRRTQKTGTVKGTFDDLSDEEKTKAFLQLLEYRLKVEKVIVSKHFPLIVCQTRRSLWHSYSS